MNPESDLDSSNDVFYFALYKGDIAIYTDFEGTRRAFLRMNRAIELARDGKPYEKLLMEGFRYYNYPY